MAVDKQQQVQELLKRAEDGARAVFESENYRNYLVTMSKFHNYSYRNSLLIYMQKPQASYVAGYVAWQKDFNRHVQKGEKGIQIVGYTPKNIKQEQEKKDAQGNPVVGADGRPETETVTRKIPYFTPVYVYDVSQTEGEPLPLLVNELGGSVQGYQDLMVSLREVSPFPIVFEDIQGGANGYCSPLEQKIAVRQGMSEAQTIKTTIHEITHADLHAPDIDLALDERKDRRTKEVEAESTAFIVCNHYGIDTSDYSFGYLASWSSTKELTELQSSLETIQKQANELIDRIDSRLAELQKEHTVEIENPAIPDKTVTVDEMQEYGFTGKEMLPLDAARATELFNTGNPVHILYSDNTNSIAPTAESITEHTGKSGLCGITSGDYNEVRATEIAARYDTLVGDGDARKAFPFSIENQQERISRIAVRVQELDFSSLDRAIDLSLANANDGENKTAITRSFSLLKEDCEAYRTDLLKQRLSTFNGEPIVTVRWSENPALSDGQTFPLHEANKIFRDYDAAYPADMEYEKTSFSLIYEKGGEISSYDGRQDFGDGDGDVIDHIRSFWQSELSPNMLSQHLAAGNTELIDEAREALNDFVPYLTAHNTLGLLEDETRAQLGNLQFMKEQGATMPELDKRIEYGNALIEYVGQARIALNNGTEAPTMPQREDYISVPIVGKEAAEIEAYKEKVRQEFTAEAAALSIFVDDYAQNDYAAPAERSFAIYQLNATGRKYRFESLEIYGEDERPSLSMYDKVYGGTLPATATLDNIYEQFNIERPADFTGHSLSISDVIAIEYKGDITANYVDKYGFESLPELAKEIAADRQQPEQQQELIGITTYANGDRQEFTDTAAFIASVKEELQRRDNETLDSVKFDNDIDLDREKTREQLGFNDNAKQQPRSAANIFKAAREKAASLNAEADRKRQQQPNKSNEIGE